MQTMQKHCVEIKNFNFLMNLRKSVSAYQSKQIKTEKKKIKLNSEFKI